MQPFTSSMKVVVSLQVAVTAPAIALTEAVMERGSVFQGAGCSRVASADDVLNLKRYEDDIMLLEAGRPMVQTI